MKFVTTPELIRNLGLNHTGPLPAMIVMATPAIFDKTHPFGDGVTHFAYRAGLLGANYAAEVNAARTDEGKDADFVAKPLWNGKGQKVNQYVIKHTGKNEFYLQFYPAQEGCGTVVGTKTLYDTNEYRDADNRIIPYGDIKMFLKPQGKSKSQGLKSDVLWRTVKLSNVKQLQVPELLYHLSA